MFGIATAGGRRGHDNFNWRIKASIYAVSSLLGGAATGLVLGALGSVVPVDVRIAACAGLAIVLLGVALAHLRVSSSCPMIERDRETAQSWLEFGPAAWAVLNGLALGSGFASRIGFVSWYVVPVSAFLIGDAVAGALVYGLYGAVRGFGAFAWLVWLRRWKRGESDPLEPILALRDPAKRLSAATLLVVATAAIVVAGI